MSADHIERLIIGLLIVSMFLFYIFVLVMISRNSRLGFLKMIFNPSLLENENDESATRNQSPEGLGHDRNHGYDNQPVEGDYGRKLNKAS